MGSTVIGTSQTGAVWTAGPVTTRKAIRAALDAMVAAFPLPDVYEFVQRAIANDALVLRDMDLTVTQRKRATNHSRDLEQWLSTQADAIRDWQWQVAEAGQAQAVERVIQLLTA